MIDDLLLRKIMQPTPHDRFRAYLHLAVQQHQLPHHIDEEVLCAFVEGQLTATERNNVIQQLSEDEQFLQLWLDIDHYQQQYMPAQTQPSRRWRWIFGPKQLSSIAAMLFVGVLGVQILRHTPPEQLRPAPTLESEEKIVKEAAMPAAAKRAMPQPSPPNISADRTETKHQPEAMISKSAAQTYDVAEPLQQEKGYAAPMMSQSIESDDAIQSELTAVVDVSEEAGMGNTALQLTWQPNNIITPQSLQDLRLTTAVPVISLQLVTVNQQAVSQNLFRQISDNTFTLSQLDDWEAILADKTTSRLVLQLTFQLESKQLIQVETELQYAH